MLRVRNLLMVVFLIVASCAPSVYSDTDPSFNFAGVRTFTWAKNPPIVTSGEYPISALATAKMTTAIKNELEAKGYRFVSSSRNADVAVSYTLGARDKIELRQYPSTYIGSYNSWGWGGRYYGYGYRPPFGSLPQTREVEVTIGTLALDMFDTKTRRPVWHSQVSKRLSDAEVAGTSDALILEAARSVLSQYPVLAK